jgi:hypothetical protein
MKRPLLKRENKTKHRSVEQVLEDLKRACDICLAPKSSGRRKYADLQLAVRELCTLWKELTGKRVPQSFDAEFGRSEELFYPGPRFVHQMLNLIDPEMQASEVNHALRAVLGKPRMRKSAAR